MLRKLTSTLALLIATAVVSITLTAAPAHAASWHPYATYSNAGTCQAVGGVMLQTRYRGTSRYKCTWDSPYWLLWLYY